MKAGRVVIFAAGTGNPFFTTDTAATLRAIEMDCQAVAKATQVDGVYDSRPAQEPRRQALRRLSYAEVLSRDLKVMDGAAIALARDNGLPVIVFSIKEPGNLLKVLRGEGRATVIEVTGVDRRTRISAIVFRLARVRRPCTKLARSAEGGTTMASVRSTSTISKSACAHRSMR